MISLIVAMDRNGLIGVGNRLPWHRPEDLKNFKNITIGKSVIMGRKTFESIGKPLSCRDNFVITNSIPEQTIFSKQMTAYLTSESLKYYFLCKGCWKQDIFIIGGASIYREFAPYVERMYITVINEKFSPDGSAIYFPWHSFEPGSWTCIEQRPLGRDFYYVFDRG